MYLNPTNKQPIPRNAFHLLFWAIVTLIFLYDRRYLILKFQLTEHFVACVVVRMILLISLVYLHLNVLIPRFFRNGEYPKYALLLLASLGMYVSLQNLYDIYLYGFVIGDIRSRDFWSAFPYNFVTTLWYLILSTGLKLSLDRYEERRAIGANSNSTEAFENEGQERQVFLKTGTKKVMTDLDSITHIKGLKDYAIIYTEDDQIIVKGSLKNTETLLGENKLIRVHKSYLVALDRIKTIQHNQIILEKYSIPIGRSYKKEVYKVLGLP
ncbi:LytR/AlgR family response regulator transcription factor [Algoriphagus resistens]|uniref:LytR/AlgR family response regulator transcription factor n=1 Tax=Algoriphagus resistens TaxID=1750590 RepID=UPI000716AB31|nr:LytTR family DNA-binding domain-containing protein [Algoriphagus resistens]